MKNILHFIRIFLVFLPTLLPSQELLTQQANLPCIDKTFTIVAHIVRDTFGDPGITEMDISDNIGFLNEDFEPICARFEICEFRYIDDFQYNILDANDWDELQVKYNLDNRINMYFIENTDDENAICGFATLGGITQMELGGVVIKKECIGEAAKTIPHEMGHYFSLRHTFEGAGVELVDGSNCETAGDGICDTPADPFVVGEDMEEYIDPENTCRFFSEKVDANGQYYEPDVGNIMSYYPASCSCGFTYQQYLKMANTFLSAPNMW